MRPLASTVNFLGFFLPLLLLCAVFWERLWDPLLLEATDAAQTNVLLQPPHSLPIWNGFSEPWLYTLTARWWLFLAVAAFCTLLFIDAPYGRLAGRNAVLLVDSRKAFFFMELPALLVNVAAFYLALPRVGVPLHLLPFSLILH